jgi:indolepyruvate ferredoxin oxidoreductase
VINTNIAPTIDVVRGRVALAGPERMLDRVNASTIRGRNLIVDGSRLAEGLFGTHLAVNLFMTGIAWQGGLIPISLEAIEEAIRLNRVEVERNLQVFQWGRKYYHDAAWVEQHVSAKEKRAERKFDRGAELAAYQNVAYAREYAAYLNKVEHRAPQLADAVARNLYKLMAIKDEYEVARLLTKSSFESRVRETFEAVESISYNLHPPLLRRFGVTRKLKLGGWFRLPLRALAGMNAVRGTPFDIFGWPAHRRLERSLVGWYRGVIDQLLDHVTGENLAMALEIAELPQQIRGYEHIKEESIERVKSAVAERLETFRAASVIV